MNSLKRGTIVGLVAVFSMMAAVSRSSAEIVKIVSPPSAAGSEGDLSVTPAKTPIRIQYLIPASDFAALPATHRYVVGFNFRSDQTQTSAVDWTFPHERTWMSTTDKTDLTTTFDLNHGPDKTLVFDGSPSYSFLGSGPAVGPRDFGVGQKLQTPFFYDPTQGNLLIEHEDSDKNFPVPVAVDLASVPNTRTLLNDTDYKSATGEAINIAAVFQLEFAIPEPPTSFLAGLSCVCLGVYRWRKGARQRV